MNVEGTHTCLRFFLILVFFCIEQTYIGQRIKLLIGFDFIPAFAEIFEILIVPRYKICFGASGYDFADMDLCLYIKKGFLWQSRNSIALKIQKF